ncbi:unnamed protein product [Ceutorhynchus assimilis]|uniref:Aurora kinase n=1 Tax=Ceutorhynchus assimilis TaxID=467358 RepID=A0A9N9Q916_9CUCU|nr:unnamed protein product [Ceutorhynchus assimilis]
MGKKNRLRLERQKKLQKQVDDHMKTLNIAPVPGLAENTRELVTKMMSHPGYNNPNYKWSLDDFELGKRLGRGAFGRVFLARERRSGYLVAVKTLLKKDVVEEGSERDILHEIEIHSHLKHPNIIQMLCWFHDSHRIYIVSDYAGQGAVSQHLKDAGRFDDQRSAKYIYQVAAALEYCHDNHVIHRDIKPENLLLDVVGDVKVADFGASKHSPSLTANSFRGTVDYIPPEMVEVKEYTYLVDNWCLGILCYEFLHGYPPFEADTSAETFSRIRMRDLHFDEHINKKAKDFISKLIVLNQKKRMSLKDAMKHPWIMENYVNLNN